MVSAEPTTISKLNRGQNFGRLFVECPADRQEAFDPGKIVPRSIARRNPLALLFSVMGNRAEEAAVFEGILDADPMFAGAEVKAWI